MGGLEDILKIYKAQDACVIGTVVDVHGSAYRHPGARMLLTQGGQRVGMISGGCLDKDVARRAWAWTEAGPRTVLYDTRGDALNPQGLYGSGCDGTVSLFLERPRTQRFDPLAALNLAWSADEALSMATVYAADAPLTALIGCRVAVSGDRITHTDPALDPTQTDALLEQVRQASGWTRPRSVEVRTQTGTITALIESLAPPTELLILGAGDDARPLCAMASAMGWRVRVADKWPALATQARFPQAREVLCAPTQDLLAALEPGPRTFVAVMTHNFNDDALLLPALLATDVPWIGLMGPRRRTMTLMRRLLQDGLLPDSDALARIQTPVGLDLGGDAPEEVALSILGGLTAFRNGHRGGLLRDCPTGHIHDEHERIALPTEPIP